jgi:hypothetical protein
MSDAEIAKLGSAALPRIGHEIAAMLNSKVIRRYVQAVLAERAIGRLYDIGMGVTQFTVPTMTGKLVVVPAAASVQVKALTAVLAIGLPHTHSVIDDDGNVLPGIFAMGPLELDQARRIAHGDRYMETPEATIAESPKPMAERIAAGEFTVVELDETAAVAARDDDAAPPANGNGANGHTNGAETPEQRALARHRARTRRS